MGRSPDPAEVELTSELAEIDRAASEVRVKGLDTPRTSSGRCPS
jgi:hypothetical protein